MKIIFLNYLDSSGIAANTDPCTSKATTVPISFDEYRKRKEDDRSSRFKPSKTNVGGSKKAKVQVQEAKVQVGLVCESDQDGKLKKIKGRTIPVLLNEDADALLRKSIEKHARHYKQFDKDDEYLILYQDMTVIKHLPGCDTPFTVGKTY